MLSCRYNPCELQSEVLGALLRIEKSKKKATVGEVERMLINIRATRRVVEQTLNDLWQWGIIRGEEFQYRPNVTSKSWRIAPDARRLAVGMVMFNGDLAPHFAQLQEVV